MAEEPTKNAEAADTEALGGTNYEVIKKRLEGQGAELVKRAQALNAQRLELFGSTELAIAGNERIRTENNCVPRDILQVGGHLLFGYNVETHMRGTGVADVFSLHSFEKRDDGMTFHEVPLDDPAAAFLGGDKFGRDFADLYSYFKDVRLLQLRLVASRLLMIFQTGSSLSDLRVLRFNVSPDGGLSYVDNAGIHDHVLPPSHDFKWIKTTRDEHRAGTHPHISIKDELFIETVGGDLTIKVEDNTEDGQGVYREPVDDLHQSLGDADIGYAVAGNLILLHVRPYRESATRYLVFNRRTKTVDRIDAIGQSCLQLPEDHGIIFPGGYYLESGDSKSFDIDTTDMHFEEMRRSPNGEDVLYVFHRADAGDYVLLTYNLIRKEVDKPLPCNGYTIFDDGTMVLFRNVPDPTRVHPMQVWHTPFVSDEFADAQPPVGGDTLLGKVGNADLVRGISDALGLDRLIRAANPTTETYEAIVKSTVRMEDGYYWLGEDDIGDLLSLVLEIRGTTELILDEFDKVIALRKAAKEALRDAEKAHNDLINSLKTGEWNDIDRFVESLAELRTYRGHLITIRDQKYMNLARIDELEENTQKAYGDLSERTVTFLLSDDALTPYRDDIDGVIETVEQMSDTREAGEARDRLTAIADGLNLLTEIVSTLDVDDPQARTTILERISEVLSQLNRARAMLEGRRRQLMDKEGRAEFAAQFTLFGQSVTSALAMCDTPDKTDEQLTRLMVQLEELESRFSDFDSFIEDLAVKRDEVYEVFERRKQELVEARQRRAHNLAKAGERILAGIGRRTKGMDSADELNAFFAADQMVMKVRSLVTELRELGDAVKADDLDSKLKASRDQSLRSLRDKLDLYEDGENVIVLGRHRFSVNTQPVEATLVPYDEGMSLHITGTDYFEPIDDDEFSATRDFWQQTLISESPRVYRGEYLAASLLRQAIGQRDGLSLDQLRETFAAEGTLLPLTKKAVTERYDEGYERGVHDADAAAILDKLLSLYTTAGLLRFAPRVRALGALFWVHGFADDANRKNALAVRGRSLGRLRESFGTVSAVAQFATDLARLVTGWGEATGLELDTNDAARIGSYLADELCAESPRFTTSADAESLRDALLAHLQHAGTRDKLEDDLDVLDEDIASAWQLACGWVEAFVDSARDAGAAEDDQRTLVWRRVQPEAAAMLLTPKLDREVSAASTRATITGLLGQHPRVVNGELQLDLDEFLDRLGDYADNRVPGYRRYREMGRAYLDRARKALRLDAMRPDVLSTFVRNRLIDEVYLPIIGDNLAKQMGSLGEEGRSDRMGLLLLISPPGYGKTTLMEYMAARLGLVFMKINGPALGHDVTSIDPGEAPNATARQEVERLNLALEMGNNVMLYLDDIQHCHPELLQKFISLCDAQRRIEGVWKGQTKTYDLRGKRFAVVMAGNPYTESGGRFQIPDMLANRADTYNLGDILEGRDEQFALSYIENCLTANPTLAPLANRDLKDLYAFIRMARGEDVQSADFSHSYSAVENTEITAVLNKLFVAQEVLLQVNMEYIRSASMEDEYRTEPPFKLQGSYRNMTKVAEKIAPVMNEQELQALIDDHYLGEAQTLTTGAEANLLKLAELRGKMTPEQEERWEAIRSEFSRRLVMGGGEDDPVVRIAGPLGSVVQKLGSIETALATTPAAEPLSRVADQLTRIESALAEGRSSQDVGERLSDIGTSLNKALTLLEQRTAPDTTRNGPDNEYFAAELKTLGQTLQNLAERKLDVHVTAQPTDEVTAVLASQLELVEWTLIPLVRTMAHDLQLGREHTEKLERVIDKLRAIAQPSK